MEGMSKAPGSWDTAWASLAHCWRLQQQQAWAETRGCSVWGWKAFSSSALLLITSKQPQKTRLCRSGQPQLRGKGRVLSSVSCHGALHPANDGHHQGKLCPCSPSGAAELMMGWADNRGRVNCKVRYGILSAEISCHVFHLS